MTWRVQVASTAKQALAQVKDRREQELLKKSILGLAEDPDKQGKALVGGLKGYRSVRAVGQRYRIIYSLDKQRQGVTIIFVGRRKDGDSQDVYATVQKLLRQAGIPPTKPSNP